MRRRKMSRDSFLGMTIQRVGIRQASNVGLFLAQWLIVHRELGHRPSVEEYAEWWKVSRATAFREQQAFRDAWPEFSTPSDVAAVLGINVLSDELPNPFTMRLPRPQEAS